MPLSVAVDGGHPHRRRRLAVAVDAAFSLLEPGGVPGQVVVDDGVEVLLEVDALGQAVGGDQHPCRCVAEIPDRWLRARRAGGAGHRLDG